MHFLFGMEKEPMTVLMRYWQCHVFLYLVLFVLFSFKFQDRMNILDVMLLHNDGRRYALVDGDKKLSTLHFLVVSHNQRAVFGVCLRFTFLFLVFHVSFSTAAQSLLSSRMTKLVCVPLCNVIAICNVT